MAAANLRRMTSLFDPIQLGDIALANRIVMAPLTRDRAAPGRVPYALNALYYEQRADPATGAGLIISEGTQIGPLGQGYLDTPGVYSPEQLAGWKRVTDAVHAKGGRIVAQIWHVGRISHTSLLPQGEQPVSSTAKIAQTKTFTPTGFDPVSQPRALTTEEVGRVVDQFRQAARNAIDAGFDGVEVHGANGYLIDQFLRDGTNHRDDAYGGPIANRVRFLVEVTGAVIGEVGAKRVGVRLSPVSPSNDASDSDPASVFGFAVDKLDELKPIYIHVVEGATGGARDFGGSFDFLALRQRFRGTYVANNGYSLDLASEAIECGRADLIAFGKPFIANPDLVTRLRNGAPLAVPDKATFYGGGARGYTDYPALASHRS
jgi:N-ethylmaleimide reductase